MKQRSYLAISGRCLAATLLAMLMAGGVAGRAVADTQSDGSGGTQTTYVTPTVPGADTETRGGGGHNIVVVVNRDDHQLRVDGRIQLNHIDGPTAAPVNEALAFSSCDGCQTFAVALQINLISPSETTFAPKNYPVAINYECTGCTTEAYAYQFNITTSDPNQVTQSERDLIEQVSNELRQLRSDDDLTVTQVETQINNIILQYNSLTSSLTVAHQQETVSTTPGASDTP